MILDACVLYPAVVRDAALRLALTDLFQARWTDAIHDEWIGALQRVRADDGSLTPNNDPAGGIAVRV